MYIYICMYVRTYTHTHTYIYIYIYMCVKRETFRVKGGKQASSPTSRRRVKLSGTPASPRVVS